MTSHHFQHELPDLRILPINRLLLHEEHDAQRSQPLAARLTADGVLRNPPVVAIIPGDDHFVVLDGANRVTALGALGIPHVLAQVVDYDDEELVLDTWHHLVGGFSRAEFHRALGELIGVCLDPSDLMHARAELARRDALAYVVYPDDGVFTICAEGDIHYRATRLNSIVDIYRARGKIYRTNTDQLDTLLPYYDDVAALIVFPHFQPAEIIELASVGARLPAGVTRHVIPRRALRVNFPIDLLREDALLETKNVRLHEWLKRKTMSREVRYYQESTFLFDE
jgi:hypothetical protein